MLYAFILDLDLNLGLNLNLLFFAQFRSP
jgi:hypothetical protein